MRTRHLLVLAIGAATAACSIPKIDFQASDDGGLGADANQKLAFVVDPTTPLAVTEGMTRDFTVALNHPPGGSLTAQVTTESAKLGLSLPELSFSDSDYSVPKAITVSGLQDNDSVDEVGLFVTLGASGLDTAQVQVNVTDDDTLKIVTDAPAGSIVTVDEGGSAEVRVHLSAEPPSDVTITAKLGIGPVTADPMSKVFTKLDYANDKIFTFSAAVDANTISEDVALTFSSSVAGITDAAATVHVQDKDVLGIQLDKTMMTVNEEGVAGQFQVSLTQQPATSVTVDLTTTTGAVNIDKTQLTFTPQNYGVAQFVAVTAPLDVDTIDGSDTIKLDAGAPIAVRNVSVTVKDNDLQVILESAPAALVVAENGTSSFDVWLAFKPTGSVTVNVASLAGAVASATPGTLTFDSTNYAAHQPVTVKGTDDPNLVTNSTTVRLSEASIGMVDIPVNVTDDDDQVILLSKTMTTITEPQDDTFTVKLKFDPGGTVSVNVGSNLPGLVSVGTSTLTFNSGSYGSAQTVTLSAVDDPDANNGDTTISVSGAGATAQSVAVHVIDNDELRLVTDGNGTLQVGEGSFVDVHVHLAAKPNGNVTVTPQFAVGQPLSVNQASLTFTTSDYAVDKTLRFTALQDGNSAQEDIVVTLHPSVAGMTDASFTVQTQDDDTLNIKLVPSATQMTENGATATLAVSLTAQPPGATTVNLTSSSGAVTLSTSAVSFTTGNWASPVNVTMTAPMDTDTVNGAAVITASALNLGSQTVNMTVIDPDTQAVMTDAPSTLNLTETGNTTFHVWLAFKPQSTTTVNIATLDGTIATVSPSFYDFTTTDWATHKTVTVMGVHNNNLITNTTKVRLSEAAIGTKDIPTNVTNNDVQAIVMNPTQPSLNINEGSNGTFTVKLAFDPGATVTLPVSSGSSALPATPASLQFSSANYSTPQLVTVNAPIDANTTSEATNIVIGGAPAGAADATASATVADKTIVDEYGWPSSVQTFTGSTNTDDGTVIIGYQTISITTTTTLDSLAVYGKTTAGTVWLGLYTNNGGKPGSMIASSPTSGFSLQTGANVIPVPPVTLTASSTYWMVIGATSNASFAADAGGGPTVGAHLATWNPSSNGGLPQLWSSANGDAPLSTTRTNLWISTHHTP